MWLVLRDNSDHSITLEKTMGRKKPKGKSAALMAFNVVYEDGMVTSNRRVSSELLDQSFGESWFAPPSRTKTMRSPSALVIAARRSSPSFGPNVRFGS